MIFVTLADLLYRVRQFLIALIGVALVMAMALLLAGLANGFRSEVSSTVDGVGATHWIMASGAHGGLTAFAAFPEADAALVAHQPGVEASAPFLLVPGQSAILQHTSFSYNLAGVEPGHLGDPTVGAGDGHALSGQRQAVVDARANAPVGSVVQLGSQAFSVVGIVNDRTLLGGQPLIYVELPAAQAIALGGRPLVSAVVTNGTPQTLPNGLSIYTAPSVIQATEHKMQAAISSIDNSTILMWIVAAIIVAALLYVAALERRRDFAILKALGSSSAELFGSLVIEAVVVTLVAAAAAVVLSHFMTFIFQQPLVIPASAYLELPIIAFIVGIVASLVALRSATRADPAAAFS